MAHLSSLPFNELTNYMAAFLSDKVNLYSNGQQSAIKGREPSGTIYIYWLNWQTEDRIIT